LYYESSRIKKTVLILDLDGVITDLDIDWRLVSKRTSEIAGHDIEDVITFLEDSYGTEMFDLSSKILEEQELKVIHKAQLFDDVKPAIKSFKGPVYIASMQSEKALNIFLDRYNLRPYLREALSRDNFGAKRRQLKYIIEKESDNNNFVLVDNRQEYRDDCNYLNVLFILFDRKRRDNLIKIVKKNK
jgi:phosphoglycolate phosphatase-like HAD superfamily hydrolase